MDFYLFKGFLVRSRKVKGANSTHPVGGLQHPLEECTQPAAIADKAQQVEM
jgi:hypothetical protein